MSPKDRLDLAMQLVARGMAPRDAMSEAERLIDWSFAPHRKAKAASDLVPMAAEAIRAAHLRALGISDG